MTKSDNYSLLNEKLKKIEELLYFFPKNYLLTNTFEENRKTIALVILKKAYITNGRQKATFYSSISNKYIYCTFIKPNLLLNTGYINDYFIIEGNVKIYNNYINMFSPNIKIFEENEREIFLKNIFPVYKNCSIYENYEKQVYILKIIKEYNIKNITQNTDNDFRKKMFLYIHNPSNLKQVYIGQKYFFYERSYFRYVCFLKQNRISKTINSQIKVEKIIEKVFNIKLTNSQYKQIEIYKENLNFGKSKIVFLYGEVGSGKTITFLSCSLIWIYNNYSVICVSPTSILNEQTYNKAINLRKININIQKVNEETDFNKIGFYFTTTKIFYKNRLEKVKNLGVIIIDEEQKFGIKIKTADSLHLIYSTATPIPRLMNLSQKNFITTMYLKRKNDLNVETHIIEDNSYEGKLLFLKEKEHKTIIIVPFLKHKKNSHILSINSIEQLLEILKTTDLEKNTIVITGEQKIEEQNKKINEFIKNKEKVFLLATPVVEIGIDIPNIQHMIIFGQENFGLSQLHQFRGRIGRNGKKSFCYIINNFLSIEKYERLSMFSNTNNSLNLSKWDGENRGYGNISGSKQSGKDIDLPILEIDKNFLSNKSDKELEFLETLFKDRYQNFYKFLNKKIFQ